MSKVKQAWPTKDAMAQVYANHLWGNNGDTFYSGNGSHDTALVEPYVERLINFLTSFNEPLTVCDLGCGDFNIGKQLFPYVKKYVAVDVVPDLIAHNAKNL